MYMRVHLACTCIAHMHACLLQPFASPRQDWIHIAARERGYASMRVYGFPNAVNNYHIFRTGEGGTKRESFDRECRCAKNVCVCVAYLLNCWDEVVGFTAKWAIIG